MINNNDSKLPSLTARLEAVKDEYKHLKNDANSLHTRAGILITLLSALVSVAFVRGPLGIMDLFKTNSILAIFRVIFLIALFVSFFTALICYITVLFKNDYIGFPYKRYTDAAKDKVLKTPNETVIIAMYKEYARCVYHNNKMIKKTIRHYRLANGFLIVTIVFVILTLITTLI